MESKIAKAIGLANEPVAVLQTSAVPEGAAQFKPGRWGCVIAMLAATSKGRIAALTADTITCSGGKAGMGFQDFKFGVMEHFLSTGEVGPKAGEFYKKTPELARNYMSTLPPVEKSECVVLKPLSKLAEDETPEAVVFLVTADQLAGLATLANYDMPTQDNIQIRFGAGCVQAIRYAVSANQQGQKVCTIGLTDPSARKCVDKNLLSFSIPYGRFWEMEANAEGSFLMKETWSVIMAR